ncbi:MAG: hypothetical protein IT500_16740 [Rubrivivax sp.]|nr:hypothetical protein [Rubrivivax sp.]
MDVIENPPMSEAYRIAKAGGAHAGLLRRYESDTLHAIEKSVRSLERIIEIHEAKMANPGAFVQPDLPASDVRYLVGSKWPKEIRGLRQELEVLEGLLAERRHGKR